jgi:mono/diheme cytochrome c family protein
MFERFLWHSAILAILAMALPLAVAQQASEPDGRELYARHCAACHGAFGDGDGPVAQAMLVAIPNLRSLSRRAGGTFPRQAVMSYIDGRDMPAAHGERLMPVWGDTFAGDAENGDAIAAQRIAAITAFLESLQN